MRHVLEGEVLKEVGFEGSIAIEMPSLVERLMIAKNNPLDGESIDTAIRLATIASERILEVDVIHIESQVRFTEKETLLASSGIQSLVYKIASTILEGVSLGKKKES